jgi:DNA uptake protein ComE-like DNA-binding protein
MKRWVAFFLLVVSSVAIGQELQKFENCRLAEAGWADGDSFPVKLPDGKEIVLRLYYVDCNEVAAATETDQRRVRDQSSYFGIDDHQITLDFGRRAADEVKQMLSKPFTVHTAFASAPGRSSKPRTYGFITLSDGRDLGEVLVREGLARSYGVRRNTPDGLNTDAAEAKMSDLELGAAIARRGIWVKTDTQRMVALRGDRRAEERELQEAFGAAGGQPIDPNTATVDEIMLLPGVGEVLAERIVEGRPYKSIDDLRRVPGVGDKVFAKLKESLQISP